MPVRALEASSGCPCDQGRSAAAGCDRGAGPRATSRSPRSPRSLRRPDCVVPNCHRAIDRNVPSLFLAPAEAGTAAVSRPRRGRGSSRCLGGGVVRFGDTAGVSAVGGPGGGGGGGGERQGGGVRGTGGR